MTVAEAGVAPPPAEGFEAACDVLIVGAGAGGMIAALRAVEAGAEVLVLEADAVPSGSTALSAGLIPAAGTRFQRAAGLEDSPETFAADILRKAHDEPDREMVASLSQNAGAAVEWLADRHGLPFSVIADFSYPGHSARRMHALPSRAGRELIDALRAACEAAGVDIVCERRVETVHAEGGRVVGVSARRPDGAVERIGCARLILACNGFGGNREMVRAHMPEIGEAIYFGHPGNRGEAVVWGTALGAATRHMGAYQGHGNVAHPHGILISWAVITEGGVQVNAEGQRFWDESQGYSEAARFVLAQPGGVAWAIFDDRIAGVARQFEDFREAERVGAFRIADTPEALAGELGLPPDALAATLAGIDAGEDAFGRRFDPDKRLVPPYWGVRVTGTLFHTQGGLETDGTGRVRRASGGLVPGLYAVGGAACGVSGSGDSGYLSGNGLLAAVVLGWRAGAAAAVEDGE